MLSDQPGLVDTDENTQPLNVEEETSKPTLKEPPNPVPRTTTAWQQYYDTMGVARQKVIEKLAKQQEYEITLGPVYDDVDRDKLVTPDEKITLRRRKISTKDFFEIERRRAVIQSLRSKDALELAKVLLDLYEGMAYIYLEDKATGHVITKAQFERIHWPVTKAILDACNLSSVAGQVPLDEKI
jgi:hypothetical protein